MTGRREQADIGPRTITASEFRAKCLKLMDEVAESGEEIVITKNGKPDGETGPLPAKAQGLVWGGQGQAEDSGRHHLPYRRGVGSRVGP